MDKNTLIGFGLIGAVLVGFSILSRPNQEEIAQMKRYQDSIAVVQQEAAKKAEMQAKLSATSEPSIQAADTSALFYNSMQGKESFTTIENAVVKLTFSNKGGRIYSATLKDYNGQNKEPLVLFNGNDASLNFTFYNKKGAIDTEDLFFTPVNVSDTTVTMRLVADSASYIDFNYALNNDSYLMNFTIQAVNMRNKLSSSINYVDIDWKQRARQIEKGFKFEERYSTLTYKFSGDDTDELSGAKDVKESIPGRLDWIAFKNQFFSSVFIAEQDFEQSELTSVPQREGSGYLKNYSAKMNTFFDPSGKEPTNMLFYFGPNKYKTLTALDKDRIDGKDLELNQLVPLGWSFLRWINRWFTIPLFDCSAAPLAIACQRSLFFPAFF